VKKNFIRDQICPIIDHRSLLATPYWLLAAIQILSSTKLMAPVSRSQFASSASSCFRPAAVSE
jgi:hypothetical protein